MANNVVQYKIEFTGEREVLRTVEKVADGVGKASGAAVRRARDESGGQAAEDRARGGLGVAGVAAGVFAGNAALGFARNLLGNLSSAVAQTFDPNLTDVERNVLSAQAAARGVPFVGEIAAAEIGAENQIALGAAQGTNRRLNEIFGAGGLAVGAALGPDASDEELRNRFAEIFQNALESVAPIIQAQERGREAASQVIAGAAGRGISATIEAEAIGDVVEVGRDLYRALLELTGLLRSAGGSQIIPGNTR